MLLIKAIFKVIGQIVLTMLFMLVCLVLFLFGCWLIGKVIYWMDVLLALIVGLSAWTAFKAAAASAMFSLTVVVVIVCVVALLVLEIGSQYQEEKRRKEMGL